jgi:hypothetical protein
MDLISSQSTGDQSTATAHYLPQPEPRKLALPKKIARSLEQPGGKW